MKDDNDLKKEIDEISIAIKHIKTYLDTKTLIKSSGKNVNKTINLLNNQLNIRHKLIDELKNNKFVTAEENNDIFNKGMVVSGGGFGLGKSRKH